MKIGRLYIYPQSKDESLAHLTAGGYFVVINNAVGVIQAEYRVGNSRLQQTPNSALRYVVKEIIASKQDGFQACLEYNILADVVAIKQIKYTGVAIIKGELVLHRLQRVIAINDVLPIAL